MADTTFVNGVTLTDADWFNDVNRLHYTIFSDPADKAAAFSSVASSAIAFTGDISPSQITGNQNDYNPTGLSTASVLRLTTDASRNITGIQGGADGRILKVLNVGSFPIVLKAADTGSSAANRFDFDTDITLQPDQGVILWYDSTDSRWRAVRVTNGEFRSMQVYTSSGANTWTKPAGLKRVTVRGVGGGGSGGGTSDGTTRGVGGGGGGGFIKVIAAASLGSTETATVGAGGAAVTGNNDGNAGGTSSFGAHCSATGGSGGSKSTGGGLQGVTGGTGTGGDINVTGGPSYAQSGYASNQGSPPAGSAPFGLGFGGAVNIGVAGTGYGAGGAPENHTGGNSGAGTGGIIIVEEFF